MKSLLRNCIYQGKNIFRDFGISFWSVVYPLIMAIFFYIAFNGMMNIELENIDIGIENKNSITYILEEIEFLNIHKISQDEIIKKLENEEIDGFVETDLNILVKKSGINQTIIKEIIEQIKQMEKLDMPIENYDFNINYILDRNQKANPVTIIFYSLIAMFSIYGMFASIEVVSSIQANLSNIGSRLNTTPLRKINFLLAGIIVVLILNLFSNGVLLIFIKYVLKLELLQEMKYSSIFIILGNLFGISLGMLIGVSNKKNMGTKTLMGIGITLILSFFAGMMNSGIKVMIDKHVPILNKINPISIITNNLYRINLLESTKSVGEGILLLFFYCVALIFISYIFLRRRSYDSI